MKKILFPLFLTFIIAGCSHEQISNPPSGDIAYGSDATTYQAEYKGKDGLNVGDKVRIMHYEFGDSLKHRQSRNFPFLSNKRQLGEATVISVLNKNYYELKTDHPQPLPGNAFIEKL